jgi:hypothetical protein
MFIDALTNLPETTAPNMFILLLPKECTPLRVALILAENDRDINYIV